MRFTESLIQNNGDKLTGIKPGQHEDRCMTLMVQHLSDEDIKDIAAWYESIVVTATLPE